MKRSSTPSSAIGHSDPPSGMDTPALLTAISAPEPTATVAAPSSPTSPAPQIGGWEARSSSPKAKLAITARRLPSPPGSAERAGRAFEPDAGEPVQARELDQGEY